jgi:hypothetical protein
MLAAVTVVDREEVHRCAVEAVARRGSGRSSLYAAVDEKELARAP